MLIDNNRMLSDDLVGELQQYERLFCGCAFINPEGALEKCAWLEPDMLSQPDLKDFWKKLKEYSDPMRAASESHTMIVLSTASTEITTSLFPENYANEIQRLRYLMQASRKIADIASAISERDEERVRDNVAKLHALDLSGGRLQTKTPLPADISDEFIMRINAQSPSLLTGLEDLDNNLGGLFMGELIIMAGRPGIGKTSVATAMAQNIATLNKDAKILFFSLEMDKIQLWARMACAKTPYAWKDIRSGRAEQKVLDEVAKASEELRDELGERLLIEDSIWDVPGMVAKCCETKPNLVIVDHLGEIRWKDDNADEVKWFGRATKILRTEIARRMHIPLLLIHQLNRETEGRDNKRPLLADLKWSGDLEAIADTVIMLYREDYYDDKNSSKPNIVPMEMWIRKNRQGTMNSCAIMNYNTRTQRFFPARAPIGSTYLPMVDNTEQLWYNKGDA